MTELPIPQALYTVPQVLKFAGFSKATLYRKLKSGEFPAPDKSNGYKTFWRGETIKSAIEK